MDYLSFMGRTSKTKTHTSRIASWSHDLQKWPYYGCLLRNTSHETLGNLFQNHREGQVCLDKSGQKMDSTPSTPVQNRIHQPGHRRLPHFQKLQKGPILCHTPRSCSTSKSANVRARATQSRTGCYCLQKWSTPRPPTLDASHSNDRQHVQDTLGKASYEPCPALVPTACPDTASPGRLVHEGKLRNAHDRKGYYCHRTSPKGHRPMRSPVSETGSRKTPQIRRAYYPGQAPGAQYHLTGHDQRLWQRPSLSILLWSRQSQVPQRPTGSLCLVPIPERRWSMDQVASASYNRPSSGTQRGHSSLRPALVGRADVQRAEEPVRDEQCLATDQTVPGAVDHDSLIGLQPAPAHGSVAWAGSGGKVLLHSLEASEACHRRLDSQRHQLLFSGFPGSATLGPKRAENEGSTRAFRPGFQRSSLNTGSGTPFNASVFFRSRSGNGIVRPTNGIQNS